MKAADIKVGTEYVVIGWGSYLPNSRQFVSEHLYSRARVEQAPAKGKVLVRYVDGGYLKSVSTRLVGDTWENHAAMMERIAKDKADVLAEHRADRATQVQTIRMAANVLDRIGAPLQGYPLYSRPTYDVAEVAQELADVGFIVQVEDHGSTDVEEFDLTDRWSMPVVYSPGGVARVYWGETHAVALTPDQILDLAVLGTPGAR